MNILATKTLFYTHAWETYLLGGLLIFLVGLLIGRLLWKHCQTEAKKVEKANDQLRKQKLTLRERNTKFETILEEIPRDPAN